MTFRRWWGIPRDGVLGVPRWRLPTAVGCLAVMVVVVSTVDVLIDGPLRRWDQRLMLGVHGLEVTGWPHAVWRVIVVGGQFWLVGSLVMIAAVVAAWRRRALLLVPAVGGWLALISMVIWLFKQALGRTPPGSGVDLLATAGQSFPSGHAALGAACLLVIAALTAGTSRRYLIGGAHVLAAGVATATVTLGYHWPSDAIAGWALGIVLGLAGRRVVTGPPLGSVSRAPK
ncbi:phosphatase PAP2 family protein [Streptosporangium sp. NPDC087985]|uniref:phosphatase PAP2 family protein n=1 Tax=Streptosporangium sp. NPDC087985 TaxID=3366196 RepID=UPI00382708D4